MSQLRPPSLRLVLQAAQVAELLEAGHTNREIAHVLGVSAPRISQIRAQLPTLEPYLGGREPLGRLQGHRDQLNCLRRQALTLAITIRRDLRRLEQELQSAELDRLLGLRD